MAHGWSIMVNDLEPWIMPTTARLVYTHACMLMYMLWCWKWVSWDYWYLV